MTLEINMPRLRDEGMRIIPLLHRDLFTSLWSVMHFPDDPARARGCAAFMLSQILGTAIAQGYELTPDDSRAFFANVVSPPPTHVIAARQQSGTQVGDVVKTLWCLICEDPATASWKRAIQVVEDTAYLAGVPGQRATLKKHLRQFAPVLHLWGAWALRGREFKTDLDQGYTGVEDTTALLLEGMNLHLLLMNWSGERDRPDESLLSWDVYAPGEDWPLPDPVRWPGMGAIPIITLLPEFVPGVGRPGRRRKPSPT